MYNVGLDSQEALFSFYYQQSRKYERTDQTCWGTSCSPQPWLIPWVPACCPSPPVTGGEWPGFWLGRIPAWVSVSSRRGQRRESCLDGWGQGHRQRSGVSSWCDRVMLSREKLQLSRETVSQHTLSKLPRLVNHWE